MPSLWPRAASTPRVRHARQTTELVYRKQLRPVIQSGATVMDRLFAAPGWQSGWQGPGKSKKPGASGEEPGSGLL